MCLRLNGNCSWAIPVPVPPFEMYINRAKDFHLNSQAHLSAAQHGVTSLHNFCSSLQKTWHLTNLTLIVSSLWGIGYIFKLCHQAVFSGEQDPELASSFLFYFITWHHLYFNLNNNWTSAVILSMTLSFVSPFGPSKNIKWNSFEVLIRDFDFEENITLSFVLSVLLLKASICFHLKLCWSCSCHHLSALTQRVIEGFKIALHSPIKLNKL